MWIHRSGRGKVSRGNGLVVVLLASVAAVFGQSTSKPGSGSTLQEHYDAAESLQAKGDLAEAAFQYKLFLANALHQVANGRAHVGRYAEAAPLFEEALALTPNDAPLKMDYAEAALDGLDLPQVQRLAQEMLSSSPKDARTARAAKLHWLLGQALLGMDNNQGARDQFAAAAAIDPTFQNQYSLSQAYLALLDKDGAAKVFARMLAQFGDTAQIHMQFGLAYARADFPEEAIPEFKKALAMDANLPDVHYSLGASYLARSGDTAFPQAEAEFHKELSLHPNDFFSYYELGYIAKSEHRLAEAVSDLTRAAALNPRSDDTFLLLGGLYDQLGKSAEEETALRKAIQVCTDPSRNHYQIRGAHYQLGLLLLREGKTAEGKNEMQVAQKLLLENRKLDAANLADKPILRLRKVDTVTDPAAAAAEKQFEQRVGPAIADSFNNLGVITAQNQDYATAAGYFQQTAQWNPALDGLDYNWGRAAFGARDYKQAVISLTRSMQKHPEDARPRVPLGMSQFMLADYSAAVNTLSPLGAQLDTVPLLAFAYAESLVKTGDVDRGIYRLERLEQAHPDFALAPAALGEVFANQHQYQKAEPQLRAALRLDPANPSAQYNLALTLIALGQPDEAQTLLTKLAQADARNPAVYYQLGKLQLDHGDTNAAIANLEAAVKLEPNDNAIRMDLARAYQQKSTAEKPGKEPAGPAPR